MTEEKTFEEQVELGSLDNIKSDGITIRVGTQIIKFVASDVQNIGVEGEVKAELKAQYDAEVAKLSEQYNSLVKMSKESARQRNRELDKRERELEERAKKIVTLPVLTEKDTKAGLSVSSWGSSGYLWSFITVYSPKYMNSKIIDPTFAKRLTTPIRIFIYTDKRWRITEVRLVKLINCEKFDHYHLSGSSDCWGQMKKAGTDVSTPQKAMEVIRDIRLVLESINRGSIGHSSPVGLPRLSTLEKHLLSTRPDPQNDARGDNSSASRRNERVGFDSEQEATLDEQLWTTA